MTRPERLLLDEMSSPRIADELSRRGHDVLALVADPKLRALSDQEVCTWAVEQDRRVVTENVRDFRAISTAGAGPTLLYTSSRSHPRSRHRLGPLIDALDGWLVLSAKSARPEQDWL